MAQTFAKGDDAVLYFDDAVLYILGMASYAFLFIRNSFIL